MALWTPANLAVSPIEWYEGDSGVTGSPVSAWANQGSLGGSAVQATSANRPAATGTLNGKTVLTFDGTDYLQATSRAYSSGALYVFVVARRSTSPTSYNSMFWAGTAWAPGSGAALQIDGPSNGNRLTAYGGNGYANNPVAQSSTTYTDGFWHVFEAGMDAAPNLAIDANVPSYNARGTGSSYPGFTGGKMAVGGNNPDSNTADDFQGDVVAVLVLNYRPTSPEIEKIQGYFAWKYGDTGATATDIVSRLPSGHSYKTAAPTSGTTTNTTVAATSATSIGMMKSAGKKISAASAALATAARAVGKTFASACATAVTGSRQVGKRVSISSATLEAAAASRRITRSLAVTASASASVARQAGKKVLAVLSSSVNTTLLQRLSVSIGVAVSGSITLIKRVGKGLSATSVSVVAAQAIRAFLVTVAVSCGTLVKRTSRIGHSLQAACTGAVQVFKAIGKRVSASSSLAVTVAAIRAFLLTISVVAVGTVSLTKRIGRRIAVAAGTVVSVVVGRSALVVAVAIAVMASSAVATRKTTAKAIRVAASMLISIARSIGGGAIFELTSRMIAVLAEWRRTSAPVEVRVATVSSENRTVVAQGADASKRQIASEE